MCAERKFTRTDKVSYQKQSNAIEAKERGRRNVELVGRLGFLSSQETASYPPGLSLSTMASFASPEENHSMTLMETLSGEELSLLISLKGMLAQYESGELSLEEEEQDEEGPAPAQSYRFSDMAIVRFIRGRKRDEGKAFRAMLRHMKWRREMEVASITTDLFRNEMLKRKIVLHGKDKAGRPLIYIFASRHRTSERDVKEMQSLIIWTLETTMKLTKPTEERLSIIFDLTGFSLACMDYEIVKMLVNILQYNYPEVLHQALVVNAPVIFNACWMVIRPWLDPVTASKVTFCSREQLLSNHVDKSQLPPDLVDHDEEEEEDDDDDNDDEEEGEGEAVEVEDRS